ncbi:MAG: hypothetical protein H7256_06490 [Bdellovibrio sp.]|nr:hypothetical protein [Bdellovibrio sp.]
MLNRFLFLFFVFISISAFSQSRCEFLFHSPLADSTSKQSVLGLIRTNLDKPIVSQCVGTCYLEATASVVESKLSHYLNKPVTISRASFFMTNLMSRIESLLDRDSEGLRSAINSAAGKIDIVSNGSVRQMEDLLNSRSIEVFTQPRTQSEVYAENKLIKYIHEKTSRFLYELTRQIDANEVQNEQQADAAFQSLLKSRINDLISDLKNDDTIKNRPKGKRLDDFEFKLRPLQIYLQKTADNKTRLGPDLEKDIINRLKQNGELELSYYHIKDYVRRRNGHDGFLELPENEKLLTSAEVKKRKLGGGHLVSVVDVLLDANHRIEYLVVKNTWGAQGDTDRGYHYISIDYLTTVDTNLDKGYNRFQIYDWQIKEDEL